MLIPNPCRCHLVSLLHLSPFICLPACRFPKPLPLPPSLFFICLPSFPRLLEAIGVLTSQWLGSWLRNLSVYQACLPSWFRSWLPPPCLPSLSPFMISLLAAAAALSPKLVSLHDFVLAYRCCLVPQPVRTQKSSCHDVFFSWNAIWVYAGIILPMYYYVFENPYRTTRFFPR